MLARARGAKRRADLRKALDPHPLVIRRRRLRLGGHPLVLRADEMQLSRGESLATPRGALAARRAIGIRTGADAMMENSRGQATVPVSTCSRRGHHPCQALADLLTMREAFGISRAELAYVGDGNNVARSLAIVGAIAGVEVAVASPAGYELADAAGAR